MCLLGKNIQVLHFHIVTPQILPRKLSGIFLVIEALRGSPNERTLICEFGFLFPEWAAFNFFLHYLFSQIFTYHKTYLEPQNTIISVYSLFLKLCHYLTLKLCQALFDKSLMTLEFLYCAMLSFKGMRFY